MYKRQVHNRGTAPSTAGTFSVEAFHCDPGTGMIWPTHFTSMGSLTIGAAIPAGGSVRVGPFLWTPAVLNHECLLAVVHGADDPAVTANLIGSVPHDQLVRFDNNVGQRNVNPQMAVPGGGTVSYTHLDVYKRQVATSAVAGQLVLCSLAGYGFARLRFAGRGIGFVAVIATMMIPTQLLMIPTYIMFTKIGIVNTLPSIIVPWLTSAFGVFLMRQFFLSLPVELEEACLLYTSRCV